MIQPQQSQNGEWYLLALAAFVVGLLKWGTVAYGILAALGTAAIIFLHQSGAFAQFAPSLGQWFIDVLNWLRNGRQKEEARLLERYDVLLGRDVDTGEWLFTNLQKIKSVAVWGVNGTGKTSFLHSMVHFIIQYYSPADVRLAFSDLKDGVDFSIYRRLPHLLCPIADNVERTNDLIAVIQDEMRNRSRLFKVVSGGDNMRLCNDLNRYHELKKQGGYHSLPALPRIVAIFEEISTFTRNAETLKDLILIAEKGRAYGIHLICCTQYPKVDSIPGNLREQLNTRIIGSMSRRAYKVAEVYREDWKNRKLAIGQWFMGIGNNGESYQVISSVLIPDGELEAMANEISKGHSEPVWPSLKQPAQETAVPERWIGSDDDKRQMLLAWFEQFKERPTVEQFQAEFGKSRGTYFNWVPQLWQEWKGE